MPRPLIGVTTYDRGAHIEPDAGPTFFAPCDYLDAVRRAGGMPVLVPPGDPGSDEILSAVRGLLVMGGGDVDPRRYGSDGHPSVSGVDLERDDFEIGLIRAAVERRGPFFGICRGVQIANVALGGTLIEHVPEVTDGSVPHSAVGGGFIDHEVTIAPDSKLAHILGATTCVAPSYHHQAIRTAAPTLTVTARAADGIIEAVEMPAHPWFVAVQWHPERSALHDLLQQRLFDAFVRACEGP